MNNYAVIDLETTGVKPGTDAITEIGWCVVRDGVPGEVCSLLIRTRIPVPAEVTELTGITNALLAAHGVGLCSTLRTFLASVGDLPLAGHNIVRFDAPFLEAACATVKLTPPARDRYLDTAALFVARRLGLRPGNRSHWQFAHDILSRRQRFKWNLDACCAALGIDCADVQRHRAAGDVVATQRLYAALTAPVEVPV